MTGKRKASKTKAPSRAAIPYEPTAAEIAAVSVHNAQRKARLHAPRLKAGDRKGETVQHTADHPDLVVWRTAFEQTFGTVNYDAATLLANAAIGVASSNRDPDAFNAVLGLIHGINPKDEIEAMLASQMVGLHLASMECMKRAQLSGQTFAGCDMNLKHASKLSRAFAGQVEALKRHRTGGQQKVTVEHVNVHSGGQAIVGNVSHQGGGPTEKSKDQPDAKQIANAPGTEMPCEVETDREAVPRSGGERT